MFGEYLERISSAGAAHQRGRNAMNRPCLAQHVGTSSMHEHGKSLDNHGNVDFSRLGKRIRKR